MIKILALGDVVGEEGVSFLENGGRLRKLASKLGADLVVSGHGHGGLIRLPFTDGLISTEHTFFPSYTAGLYEKNGSALFVTRGLGNSGITFRLFNRPEVAVLTLHKG